jgi:hypothetical protein
LHDRTIQPESGVFTATGFDAGLNYAGQIEITAGAGSFSIFGQDSGLLYDKKITIESAAYSESGQGVALLKDFSVEAEAGNYSESGQPVDLIKTNNLAIDAGYFSLTGQDIAFSYGKGLLADSGEFNLDGQDVSFVLERLISYSLSIEGGQYIFTGQGVTLWQENITLESFIQIDDIELSSKVSNMVMFDGRIILEIALQSPV